MSDVTHILSQIESGDPWAADQLLPLVYDELRKLAAAQLANEKPGQTLQATALVHEAYLRLAGDGERRFAALSAGRCCAVEEETSGGLDAKGERTPADHWNSRGHFFAAAAEAMRRILVENARRKLTHKRGGARRRLELVDAVAPENLSPVELLALDDALQRLEQERPDHAALVKLRYFSGLTLEDAACSLGISLATAKRRWTLARAWLFGQLADPNDVHGPA